MESGLAGSTPGQIWVFFLREQPSRPYIIREADAQACEFWGCVLYFVAKLDSPSNIWEAVLRDQWEVIRLLW